MFAMLRRQNKNEQADNGSNSNPGTPKSGDPSSDNQDDPYAPKPIGVAMKFQYGSGESPLDGYIIKRGVGSGGFGEVYFAESDSGKEVALKRIQKNLEVEVRGVRHCLNLRHPNLVGIYDIRFDKLEQGWIVMEFIDGDSLRDRLDKSPIGIALPEAQQLFAQIAAGVAYLHDQGIVHRDLKPANVFIDGGLIKIGDYGLSKYISASRRGGQTESVGTFHYMAPEIGKGEYGKEIDIYSLGIILYEMITGNVPFDGESSQEIILKHLTADPDLTNVPQPFAYVIQRAMAKNPTSRFRDCREMLAAMGWQLDASGLASKNTDGRVPDAPPILKPIFVDAHSPRGAASPSPANAQARQANAANPFVAAGAPISPSTAYGTGTESQFREPLAVAAHKAFMDAQNYFRNMPKGPRGVIIVFSIIFLVTNSAIIAPILFFLFGCYACYYFVWYVTVGANLQKNAQYRQQGAQRQSFVQQPFVNNPPGFQPVRQQSPQRPQPDLQATVHYNNAVPPPLNPVKAVPLAPKTTFKSWQSEQRRLIQQQGLWSRLHSITSGLTFSGVVAAVLAVGAGIIAFSRNDARAPEIVAGIAWLGVMTLVTSWVVIFLSRRWESRSEDSIVFRFVQLTVGIGLGLLSYELSQFLLLNWADIQSQQHVKFQLFSTDVNKSWRGFYGEDSVPLLAGHIAYFGLLMWLVRWWRQSDVLRKSRFGVWPIVWSVVMAGLAQGLVYFPGPWCLIYAGATSFVVQIASPWIDFNEPAKPIAQNV